MSQRDSLINKANRVGTIYIFALLILMLVALLFYKQLTFQFIILFLLGFILLAALLIWLFNIFLYKKGEKLLSAKGNYSQLSFQVTKPFTQIVIDIIWELKASPFQNNETAYTLHITDPEGKKEDKLFNLSNMSAPMDPQPNVETVVPLYWREGDQYVINTISQGNYSITIDTPPADSGFKIVEVKATAWK